MKKKKPTKGENIAAKFFDWLPEEAIDSTLAKAIDRAIRSAVKDAWSTARYFQALYGKNTPDSREEADRVYDKFWKKY